MNDRPSAARLPALDGLRALAALTVFLANFHNAMGMRVTGQFSTPIGVMDLATYAESGVGVVVFLVLTGALLSVPFWRDLGAPARSFRWRQFALKRLLRIAPPYYACLFAIAIVTGGWRNPLDYWRHVLFVNNLSKDSFYDVSMQFWTIGVFVQLYVLLPLVFVAVRATTRRPSVAAVLVATAAVGAYLLHAALASRSESIVVTHSTLAHFPHALLGVLAGGVLTAGPSAAPRHSEPRSARSLGWDAALCASLAAAVLLSSIKAAEQLGLPHGRYLLPWLPFVVALAVAAAPRAAIGGQLLALAPLAWLGVISYGVYIFHLPAMELVERLMIGAAFDRPATKLQFGAASLAVTLAAAAASYVVLERPLRRWVARRFSG